VCVRRGKLLKYSGASMPYLVRLTGGALRDMEAIYERLEDVRLSGDRLSFMWVQGRAICILQRPVGSPPILGSP